MASPIHVVTETSPTRYFVRGADSGDKNDPTELDRDEVKELALSILKNGMKEEAALYLEIDCKKPNKERLVQRISSLTNYSVSALGTIDCVFSVPPENSIFFSAGYKERWSKLSVYYEENTSPLLLR